MRITLRIKLLGIVAIAAAAFLSFVGSTTLISNGVSREVATIQNGYLPKVRSAPRLEAAFERLTRAFQDAASAGDLDSLNDTAKGRSAFLQELAVAHDAIDPHDYAALRAAFDDYFAAASDVSARLIANETGENLGIDIAHMQAKQRFVAELLRSSTSLDEGDLVEAFSSVREAGEKGLRYQLGISIACFVAVALIAGWLGRGVLRSLSELSSGLRRFGGGDFSRPVAVVTRDELADVAEHANRMAVNLERLYSENLRAEAALIVANRELEAFSYSVAHDLRAPLRAISGFAEILLETHGEKVDAEGRRHLEILVKNAEKMGLLIDALLSLARVGRKELNVRQVDLSEMAREELAQLASAEPGRAVEAVVEPGIGGRADPQLARAILQNLLANAWKFTSKRAAARVEFGVTDQDGARAFFVRDNGAGFDMAFAKKLFGAFQRLHTEKEFAGTGIGLATVQRIVSRHGGRIWAEGAVDRGATFYFTLSAVEGSSAPPANVSGGREPS